jgi:hypothetical protein
MKTLATRSISKVSIASCFLLAALLSGCGGGTPAAPPQPISVSLSRTSATIEVGATSQFTATVTNDSANMGVIWTASCSAAPSCGSVSPVSTASGKATTFTPPATQTAPLSVKLTATSAADPTKFQNAIIMVPAVTVSLSSTSANLQLGAHAPFSATVTNDGANAGVNWAVSCPQPSCGSVSPAQTPSGTATTYTAPTAPPSGTLSVTLTSTSAIDSAVVASATITVPGITVSISPNGATLQSGGTQQFAATVTGDPTNGGVGWSLVWKLVVCNPEYGCNNQHPPVTIYNPCNNECGTVSSTSTAPGSMVTYTAPGHFGPKAPGAQSATLLLQANSLTNSSALSQAALSLLPISVSVSPTSTSVALQKTQQLAATVTNDATNSGVTWSLTQNGVACSPGCGTIGPTNTPSGKTVTYNAPAAAPSSPLVTVTAISVEDNTQSVSVPARLTTSTGGGL